ncbi:MAG: DUF4105 domain-containing protein [Spirochaetes bacterium]|nr:DUF4105 domain-containing protein [Spirochaetota bacterium]MBN2772035.1 DUF4105 domain-containing protein [Spirochaetota bacterium]
MLFRSFFLLLVLSLFAGWGSSLYGEELMNKAVSAKLYNDPYWHTLLHYRFYGYSDGKPLYRSDVKSRSFFLSENGKNDPKAEMTASIQQILIEKKIDIINRFPARSRFLAGKLSPSTFNLDNFLDHNYKHLISTLDDFDSIKLVYTGEYMGNPASFFGHTFLRIDHKNEGALLGTSLNYAARVNSEGSIAYIVKGVTGGFDGYYSVNSYFSVVRDYSYRQSRNIWEYSLNIDRQEYRRLLDHLIELSDISSEYYFFDRNCSYMLLYLLEAARPGVTLVDKTGFFVMPVETVKLAEESGLIEETVFRPSIGERLYNRTRKMRTDDVKRAVNIALQIESDLEVVGDDDLSDSRKASILDFSLDYYRFLEFPRLTEKEYDQFDRKIMRLNKIRSLVKHSNEDISLVKSDPLLSHGPFRLSSGWGRSDNERNFVYMGIRPAVHSLTDPPAGYRFGSSVTALDTEFRIDYERPGSLYVQSIKLMEIVSLEPLTAYSSPLSYRLYTGVMRGQWEDEIYASSISVETGFSLQPVQKLLLFAMPGFTAGYSGGEVVGAGVAAGFICKFTGSVIYSQFKSSRMIFEVSGVQSSVEGGVHFGTGERLSINLESLYQFERAALTVKTGCSIFF